MDRLKDRWLCKEKEISATKESDMKRKVRQIDKNTKIVI